MKRIKFLSGISAMCALAAVALATTFTSCDKEDINIDVKQVNAKVDITPQVTYVNEDKVSTDVTSLATISIGSYQSEGNPSLPAQTVTVSASYKGYTTSVDAILPALNAGQYACVNVSITLYAGPHTLKMVAEAETDRVETPATIGTYVNTDDNEKTYTVKYMSKSGDQFVSGDIDLTKNLTADQKTLAEDFIALYSTANAAEPTATEVEKSLTLAGHTMKTVTVTNVVSTMTYKLVLAEANATRANLGDEIATVVTKHFETIYNGDDETLNPTTSSAGHEHGHSHGDGNNTGGGEGSAD